MADYTPGQVREAIRMAEADGDTAGAAELQGLLDALVRSEQMSHRLSSATELETMTGEGIPRAAAREFTQSALFGGADELAGATTAGLAKTFGPGQDRPFTEVYAETRDAERAQAALNREKAPQASGAAEQWMGVGQGAGLLAAAPVVTAAAPQLLAKAGAGVRALAGGAAGGGAMGFLGSEAEGGALASDTLHGAGWGAVAGTALPLGLYLGKTGGEWLRKLASPAVDSADSRARRAIQTELEAANLSPQDIADWTQAQGPGVVAGQHPVLQGLAAGGPAQRGPGREAARLLGGEHARRQMDDIMETLGRVMGRPGLGGANFRELRQHLRERTSDRAKPLYDSIYGGPSPVPQSPELQKLMEHGPLKEAFAKAQAVEGISTQYKPKAWLKPDGEGGWTWENIPTWRELDMMQRVLRQRGESAMRAAQRGEGGTTFREGEQWLALRRELTDAMDGANDDFRQVRAQYADDVSVEHHFDLGTEIFTNKRQSLNGEPSKVWDSEVLEEVVSQMSAPERAAFETGALKGMRNALATRRDNLDAGNLNVFATPEGRARLEAVFGTQETRDILEEVERLSFNQTSAQGLSRRSGTGAEATFNQSMNVDQPAVGWRENAMRMLAGGSRENRAETAAALGPPLLQHDPSAFLQFMQNGGPVMQNTQQFVRGLFPQSSGAWGTLGGAASGQLMPPTGEDLFRQ